MLNRQLSDFIFAIAQCRWLILHFTDGEMQTQHHIPRHRGTEVKHIVEILVLNVVEAVTKCGAAFQGRM